MTEIGLRPSRRHAPQGGQGTYGDGPPGRSQRDVPDVGDLISTPSPLHRGHTETSWSLNTGTSVLKQLRDPRDTILSTFRGFLQETFYSRVFVTVYTVDTGISISLSVTHGEGGVGVGRQSLQTPVLRVPSSDPTPTSVTSGERKLEERHDPSTCSGPTSSVLGGSFDRDLNLGSTNMKTRDTGSRMTE